MKPLSSQLRSQRSSFRLRQQVLIRKLWVYIGANANGAFSVECQGMVRGDVSPRDWVSRSGGLRGDEFSLKNDT